VILTGWATLHAAITRLPLPSRTAGTLVLLLCALWTLFEWNDLQHAREKETFPWREEGVNVMAMSGWIKENVPDAVVMTRHPCAVHFYSGAKTVRLPEASYRQVFEVARYYGVTHLMARKNDPLFTVWFQRRIPGLERIHRGKGGDLFRIVYSEIPAEIILRGG
jgi:hypothetical protein